MSLPLNRRRFLQASATLAACSALPWPALASQSTALQPGLQLYTLRDWMAVSVPGTLQLVAGVGYTQVEFAGYYSHSPQQIRRYLDDYGLSAPAAHIPLTAFEDSVQQVIDTAGTIGHQYVVIPYLTDAQRGDNIDVYKRLADKMNHWGEACQQAGLTLGYHNHDFEFLRTSGELPFDVLLNNTNPDTVTFEMDLYWMAKAGQDPLAYFDRYPGRFALFHVKDMDKEGAFADVGSGTIDFARTLTKAHQAGLRHPFVERDQTQDKLATIQQGYQALSQLLAANKS